MRREADDMTEKRICLERVGYSDEAVAKHLFPHVLRSRFWWGFLFGIVFMSLMNIGDAHLCVGECDSEGVTIWNK